MPLLRIARATRPLARTFARGLATAADAVIERDVVVVGGGPIGLSVVAALGASQPTRQSLSVALVEAGDLSKVADWSMPDDAFSNRVVTITNVSRAFLTDIGAWSHVREGRVNPVEEIQAWDGLTDSRITFNGPQDVWGPAPLSSVIEVLNIQQALLNTIRNAQVDVLDKTKVQTITKDTDGEDAWPLVHLSDGRVLRARLLIGADGFNSPVRSFAHIGAYGWDYDRRGIVATLQHVPRESSLFSAPNTTAYQRFLPTGPIAFLPINATRSSMVWSVPTTLATTLQSLEPQALAHMVNAAFRLPDVSLRYLYSRLPISAGELLEELRWREHSHSIPAHSALSASAAADATASIGVPPENAQSLPPLVLDMQPGTVAPFPLRFQHVDEYVRNRIALVGDAAHTMNPLAGQGMNIGLADAAELAKTIENAVLTGSDIGAVTALQPYARARYLPNHLMLSGVDKLHKLYATTFPPVVAARSAGLEVVNELDGLKDLIMGAAGSNDGAAGSSRANSGAWGHAARAVEVASGAAGFASLMGQAAISKVAGMLRR
ncbi:ubiquinone biosynthesis hydrox [Auriculariales sp. MPI-PUGE-AT-0066]|nr:ubiquinone biosynthesis hydrox [Auriculariales sp. MPI-PUGE-AT-0066]